MRGKKQVIPEKMIENSILSFLKVNNVFVWKNQSVGVFDAARGQHRMPMGVHHMKGVPDILGVIQGGRFLAIEVKSSVGKISPFQKVFLLEALSRGAVAFVARSIADVETIFMQPPNYEEIQLKCFENIEAQKVAALKPPKPKKASKTKQEKVLRS